MRRPLPDHLRVPWGVVDAILVFLLAWIGAPIVVVLAARSIAPNLPLAATFVAGLREGDIIASFALALIDAVAGFLIVWLYLRKYKAKWFDLGLRKFNFGQAILLIIAVYVGFLALVAAAFVLVTMLIPGFNANQAQTNEFTGSAGAAHHSLALIALVVIPPIIEETIFRGFIFPALSKRWGAIFGAIATSVLFGIAHLQANISLYTFVLSLLLCFMYYRLKSIIPGMALHMINNYIAFAAISAGMK